MKLRAAANGLLRNAGIEVRRKPVSLVRSPYELALTMEYACAHLAAFNPGAQFTVLQVGAFDGKTNDPVAKPLRQFGWRGILVEPQPGPFAELRTLHEGDETVQVYNVAIGEKDGSRPMYQLVGEGLPSWAAQATTFDRGQIDAQRKSLPANVTVGELQVEMRTFGSLLGQARADRVDVLQIDAEGYDYELLKLFDVPKRLPAIVGYEHQHLSRTDRNAAARLLVNCGYRLAMTFGDGDTVAVLS
jgi:FkbM family methyltransferase